MNIEEEVGDPFEELVKRTETSPGAPFETENLKLLSDLKKRDRSKFEDLRAKLKSAGARVSELDHLIYEDKAEDANTVDQPHWHVEPYPLTVLGSALVEAIASRIKSHVVLSDDEALVVALWVVLSWTHEAAVHSPILLITSPEKGVRQEYPDWRARLPRAEGLGDRRDQSCCAIPHDRSLAPDLIGR
jgi:hypothetical protein